MILHASSSPVCKYIYENELTIQSTLLFNSWNNAEWVWNHTAGQLINEVNINSSIVGQPLYGVLPSMISTKP